MDILDNRQYEVALSAAKKRLQDHPSLSKQEKALVHEFCERLVVDKRTGGSKPLEPSRQLSIIKDLIFALGHLKPEITKATQKDYIELDQYIEKAKKKRAKRVGAHKFKVMQTDKPYSASAKQGFRKTIRAFIRWLAEIKEFNIPQPKRGVLSGGGELKVIQEEDVLRPEEARKLLSVIKNRAHRAFFSLLVFDCTRPHEIRELRIKDVHLEDAQPYIRIPESTKTGTRSIPVFDSAAALHEWLLVHPQRDNPDAWLFPIGRTKRISDTYSRKLLKHYFEVAKLKKPPRLYNLRHTAITSSILEVGVALTQKRAGQQQGSRHTARYTQLTNQDVADAIKKARGLITEEKPEEKMRACFFCGFPNDKDRKTCARCMRLLDRAEIIKKEQKEQEQLDHAIEKYMAKHGLIKAEKG